MGINVCPIEHGCRIRNRYIELILVHENPRNANFMMCPGSVEAPSSMTLYSISFHR